MKKLLAFLLLFGFQLAAQDMSSCPMHQADHAAEVEKHGDQAMGFGHDKTTHHFLLYSDGGGIEVTANDRNDSQNISAIRSHLAHIATMFSDGDFSIPMFIHDRLPPGAEEMKKKRALIFYAVEELPAGGIVHIRTSDRTALEAIHQFLRFQIDDHGTGDTAEISSSPR